MTHHVTMEPSNDQYRLLVEAAPTLVWRSGPDAKCDSAASLSWEVRTALDGRRALAVLDEEPIDVAVVDLIMPDMDGEALVAAMRARGLEVPVIIASTTPELAERARGLDVFAWLAKPFTLQALKRYLVAALG